MTQGGIYRSEFLHENNDHLVSQVLDMQLSWTSPRESPLPNKLIYKVISHFCWCQQKWFLVCKTHTSHVTWLITSSVNFFYQGPFPGVSFSFIGYVEPETPGGGGGQPLPSPKFSAYNKNQISRRVKVHEKSCTKPCHSLIHSLSLTLDLAKCPKLFYSFISTLFTPFF